jgi:hypothetical protein
MKFSKFKSLSYFDNLVLFLISYLSYRLYFLIKSEAFSDRSQFFIDGIYASNIVDMLINEVFFSVMLALIVVGRFRWKYIIFILICSVVYFTRASVALLCIACMVSPGVSHRSKIILIATAGVASLLILVIRFGGELPGINDLILFYIKYPFVGIGRLIVTDFDNNVNHLGALSLFFRPFGAFTFTIDYFWGLDGSLSIERHAGLLLSSFVYVPLLDDDFNAFGSILFPYVVAYGNYFGVFVFILSMSLYYYSLKFIFNSKFSWRFLIFLAVSGFLFSWNSPFIWVAPFFVRLMGGFFCTGHLMGTSFGSKQRANLC